MKKKILSALILVGSIATPLVASAADSQIGTWAYSLAQGAPNIYYQGKLSDKTAWLVDVGTVSSATAIFAYYKGYTGDYANSLYWKAGGAVVTVGGASGAAASAAVGYEATVAGSLVVGGFVGILAGSGGTATAYDISIGYKF